MDSEPTNKVKTPTSLSFAIGVTTKQIAIALRLFADTADACATQEEFQEGISKLAPARDISVEGKSLRPDEYDNLVKALGEISYKACCGDNRDGLRTGAIAGLQTLGYEIESQQFYQDVAELENRLYDIEHGEEE